MKINSNDHINTSAAAAGHAANHNPSNFAALLQQNRTPAAPPRPLPAPIAAPPPAAQKGAYDGGPRAPDAASKPSEGNESADAGEPTAESDASAKPRQPAKPRARGADSGRAARDERNPASAGMQSRGPAKTDCRVDDNETADPSAERRTDEPVVAPGTTIICMAPNSTPAAASALPGGMIDARTATNETDAAAEEATEAVETQTRGTGRGNPLAAAGKQADARARADRDNAMQARAGSESGPAGGAASKDGNAVSNFAAAFAETRHATAATHRGETTISAADAAHGAIALATPTAPTTSDASSTSATQLRAAVGSPEFPQELGVQLSVLARDGVQHAELHLNPTEMGPVSVQIVMDGTQARIDFGADVAATRQAIEAGLPELASALRDAGYTLAGGGVSQHAGGRSGSSGDGSSDGTGGRRVGALKAPEANEPRMSAAVRTRVSAGGVDVYA